MLELLRATKVLNQGKNCLKISQIAPSVITKIIDIPKIFLRILILFGLLLFAISKVAKSRTIVNKDTTQPGTDISPSPI